ncbi:copper chaperone PCu(A)C [Rhodobacteraceae bacterium CCMM004]|nr:copper chaperone PCu(A)C [Rhodobacteraceae bacterium CCMM004]
MTRIALAAALAAAFATPAAADPVTLGDLTVADAYAFETAPMARAGAGYLTLINAGTADERLLEVRAGFPKVMIHETVTRDGVAAMEHRDGVDIPAGSTVTLAPGGYHVMFMGLGGDPFEPGEEIAATLVFETAGEVEIRFAVRPREGASGHGG